MCCSYTFCVLPKSSMHSLYFAAYWKHSKVTERKHRSVKSTALFVFRSLEHTSLASILNAQCEQALEGHSMFRKQFLVSPSHHDIFDVRCSYSRTIVLECGQASSADLVHIRGGGVSGSSMAASRCSVEFAKMFVHTYMNAMSTLQTDSLPALRL